MKHFMPLTLAIITCVFGFAACTTNAGGPNAVSSDIQSHKKMKVYTSDIDRFWLAYDAITTTDDPYEQLVLLNDLYIDVGSPGLHAMMRARRYYGQEYLQSINDYPKFWEAVRANTADIESYAEPISEALEELKTIYPEARDVPVYFVIGALRASGTALDNKLLIGAELATATSETPSHEFGERLSHLSAYLERNPVNDFIALNLHEYVHTQQRTTSGNSLLSQALFEGVAEYMSTAALGRTSTAEAILFGKSNHADVIAAFEKDILKDDYSDWIWNSSDNPFGVRDLGYYVGYVIAERYTEQADDKKEAIKTLIELDYLDPSSVSAIVDQSGVFPKSVSEY